VINKLVKPTVELIPAKITLAIKTSWLPTPVYFVLHENGVTNVQPEQTAFATLFLATNTFFLLSFIDALLAAYQKDSG
jgi:hypothetical protein